MPRHRLNGNGLRQWPAARLLDLPIVVKADELTAKRLGLSLDQLLEVAATLEQWGLHASGEPVYRWRDLLVSLGQLPEPGETTSHRGGRAAQRKAAQRR
jgi:hypothetical protein